MHHHDMVATQLLQHIGQRIEKLFAENTQYLIRSAGRIGEGAENIENSACAHLAAWPNSVLHGTVMGRGKHKADTDFLYALSHLFG